MLVPRSGPLRFPEEDAVLDNFKREMPVKLSRNLQIIERILVQLLVFSPW
jgi:hypothetical protein